jgi:hypothetical protein
VSSGRKIGALIAKFKIAKSDGASMLELFSN